MSLNAQASAERVHIGFFGLRNAGKSSLVNRVTGQELSVVSEVRGTTTDPVRKAMELLPLGPVVIIDTPGLDDEGTLGEERVRRARLVLDQTDIAVLVVDAAAGLSRADRGLTQLFEERHIPYVIAMNKADTDNGSREHPGKYDFCLGTRKRKHPCAQGKDCCSCTLCAAGTRAHRRSCITR